MIFKTKGIMLSGLLLAGCAASPEALTLEEVNAFHICRTYKMLLPIKNQFHTFDWFV